VELTNKVVFTRAEPFALFIGNSSSRNVLGFGNPSHAPGGVVAWDDSERYMTDSLVANDVFGAVPSTLSSELAFAGPVPVTVVGYSVPLTNKIRQRFVAGASGLLSSVTVRKTGTAIIQAAVYDMSLDALVDSFSIAADGTWTSQPSSVVLAITGVSATGTHVTLTASSPHGLVARNIIVISNATTLGANGTWVLTSVTSTTLTFASSMPSVNLGDDVVVYASKEILEGTEYALELASAADEVYKAETFLDTPVLIEAYVSGAWTSVDSVNALSADVGVTTTGYRVEAPGQCNLTGERYVLVRSPDIEQHIHRSFAAAFDRMAPGLGMLKLGGGMGGFREERLNFLAYSTRKFHPIGKLNGLHIRLETRAGRLYDSHGIDHTLLLCVKMYSPGPSKAIPRDLYPDYTPDAHQGLVRKLTRERR
jgi:hypothetical protein